MLLIHPRATYRRIRRLFLPSICSLSNLIREQWYWFFFSFRSPVPQCLVWSKKTKRREWLHIWVPICNRRVIVTKFSTFKAPKFYSVPSPANHQHGPDGRRASLSNTFYPRQPRADRNDFAFTIVFSSCTRRCRTHKSIAHKHLRVQLHFSCTLLSLIIIIVRVVAFVRLRVFFYSLIFHLSALPNL
jgi:hypothetical protein